MKKRLFTVLLALLLTAALLPAAALAEGGIVVSLGSVRAGSALDVQIATTASGVAALSGGSLPDGCVLVSEPRGEQAVHYLRGTPSLAGTSEFTITVTDSYVVLPPADEEGEESGETLTTVTVATLSCSITVLPAIPSYTVRDVDCFVGEEVTISPEVYAADGGTLSYQWYRNTVRENKDGELLEGKTGRELKMGMDFVGVTYFYCVITNNNNGLTESVTTQVVTVNVKEPEITSIAIAALPTKLEYEEGEELDTKGLKLLVLYSNGMDVTDDEGFTCSPTKLDKPGTQTVTVSYRGKTVTFPVVVKEMKEVVETVTVTALPVKREYKQGERLDTTGLVLETITNKGKKATVTSGFTCSPELLDKTGLQLITVSIEGKTTTFTVTVQSGESSIRGIAIQLMPNKLSYQVGEAFDSTGMVLLVTTDQGEESVRGGFSCSPARFTQAGKQVVTISYGGHSCTLELTVAPADGSPAEQEPAAETRPHTASQPVQVPATQTRSRNAGNTMVLIIVFLALAALVALLAYVYVSKRDSVRAYLRRLSRRK